MERVNADVNSTIETVQLSSRKNVIHASSFSTFIHQNDKYNQVGDQAHGHKYSAKPIWKRYRCVFEYIRLSLLHFNKIYQVSLQENNKILIFSSNGQSLSLSLSFYFSISPYLISIFFLSPHAASVA